jgi:hypothetical protein
MWSAPHLMGWIWHVSFLVCSPRFIVVEHPLHCCIRPLPAEVCYHLTPPASANPTRKPMHYSYKITPRLCIRGATLAACSTQVRLHVILIVVRSRYAGRPPLQVCVYLPPGCPFLLAMGC